MSKVTDRSKDIFETSKKYIPGGVNSPVRAFGSVGGMPIVMRAAKGAMLYDEDGNAYIDLINAWGPMILGHAHPEVVEAIQSQVAKGTVFGTPSMLETDIAELICTNVPNAEQIRMESSGTEACMSAIRLARGYTGRSKVIKFEGCYHGHADAFLVKAGSGALTTGNPSSAGVPKEIVQETLLAKYNDLQSVAEHFAQHPNDIAAMIVEPVAGNMGCIPPQPGFLEGLRKLCDAYGTVLIFDEVMTGFRLAFGGAQELYGINADLVCFGKIIGGGLPVAAFGGKREIMRLLSPEGPVYQAGTLSGNPVGMIAGLTTLRILLRDQQIYTRLARTTQTLANSLSSVFNEKGIPVQIRHVGSMISVFFTKNHIANLEDAKTCDVALFARFFHHMLEKGVYLPPSQFESWFLSGEIGEMEVDKILEAAIQM